MESEEHPAAAIEEKDHHEAEVEQSENQSGKSIQEIIEHLEAISTPSYTAVMLKEGYDSQREVSCRTFSSSSSGKIMR